MFIVLAATGSDATPDIDIAACSVMAGFTHYFILLTVSLTVMFMYSVYTSPDKNAQLNATNGVLWDDSDKNSIALTVFNVVLEKDITNVEKDAANVEKIATNGATKCSLPRSFVVLIYVWGKNFKS